MTKILFVILILSFSIWGVADHITRQPSERPAITVGDVTISAKIVQEEFNRDVTRLRTILDKLSFTAEDAHRLGFMQRTINRLAVTAALDVAARAYHLRAPDELLAKSISRNTNFHDATGNFNRTLFQHTVAAQGQSEEVYLRDLRQRLLRVQLSDPLIHAVTVPETSIEHFKQHRYERRVAEIVTLPIVAVPVFPPPDSVTLEAFYKDNAATFTAPEYRTISAILLTRATVAPLVSIADDVVQRAYDESRPTLRIPETRTVEHVLLASREQAESMRRLLIKGLSLTQAADALAHHVTPLGRLNRAEMEKIEPALAEAVFTKAPLDTVLGPIKSAFGWHLMRVTATFPAGIASLALVRDQIQEDLIAEKTGDVVYDLSGKVEDAINGGASLEEAAQHVGLSVSVFSVDKSGLGRDGRIVPPLPSMREFLAVAFTTKEGSQSIMTESDSGFFVLRVDRVLPAMLLPMKDISQELIDKWAMTQSRNTARQKAENVEKLLRGGLSLQEAALDYSSSFHVSKPLLRTDGDEQLPPTFITRLFRLAVGETLVDENAESFFVGRLQSIRAPVLDASTLVDMKREMTKQYTEDILAQFAAAVGREFNATINSRALEVP